MTYHEAIFAIFDPQHPQNLLDLFGYRDMEHLRAEADIDRLLGGERRQERDAGHH